MAAGDVASRLATQTLVALVLKTPDWVMLTGDAENETILTRMAERYRKVDSALREEATVDPKLSGMGTTMTVAYNLGIDLFLGHVGDSRAYLLRGAELHRLTQDHTLAQALADVGAIPTQEVVKHQFRHMLTRYLGAPKPVKADVQQMRLVDGDQVLLCTDGLTEMLDDSAIAGFLREAKTAEEACQALIAAALKQGGKDNVTVALARYRLRN
jgi:protein phosphatase